MDEKSKILIVDDEPPVCSNLQDQLDKHGYLTVSCGTGTEAIAHLTHDKYDLVLLDINLPDMAGYKVMDHINQHDLDTLVILMTGYASLESAITALRKGAYDYLRKPLLQAELLKTTENALVHKRLVSDHLQSDKALRESEKSLRDLVDNSLIGISIVQDDQIVFQNPEQKALFGSFSLPFVTNPAEFVHPDDLEKVMAAYQDINNGKVPTIEMDFRFYTDGKFGDQTGMKWVQCRSSRFTYRGKDAILVNMMDITRAKELENLVMIKHKMTALGGVAAGIAHEIRNPLTGINSYLYTLNDLLAADTFNHENRGMMSQIAQQIQTASNKIEAVIQRVLDFSKPNIPKMVPIDINEAVQSAISLSTVTLRKSGIKIEVQLAPKLPLIFGDTHMIEQVILNLLTNADRAMDGYTENKRVVVSTAQMDTTVVIKVADTGPGVPVKIREKVFDPFFTTKPDGSGIGLSIVQRIIADHNGTIDIDSSQWDGAKFVIKLPIEKRMSPR